MATGQGVVMFACIRLHGVISRDYNEDDIKHYHYELFGSVVDVKFRTNNEG